MSLLLGIKGEKDRGVGFTWSLIFNEGGTEREREGGDGRRKREKEKESATKRNVLSFAFGNAIRGARDASGSFISARVTTAARNYERESRGFSAAARISLRSGSALVCLTKRLNELPETRVYGKSGPKLTLTTKGQGTEGKSRNGSESWRRSIAGDIRVNCVLGVSRRAMSQK